jgi:hypothetical protein
MSGVEAMRLHAGFSVFATVNQARKKLEAYPGLGNMIAKLEIPDHAPVQIEKTLGRGHHTIWADPDVMLRYVVSILPPTVVR